MLQIHTYGKVNARIELTLVFSTKFFLLSFDHSLCLLCVRVCPCAPQCTSCTPVISAIKFYCCFIIYNYNLPAMSHITTSRSGKLNLLCPLLDIAITITVATSTAARSPNQRTQPVSKIAWIQTTTHNKQIKRTYTHSENLITICDRTAWMEESNWCCWILCCLIIIRELYCKFAHAVRPELRHRRCLKIFWLFFADKKENNEFKSLSTPSLPPTRRLIVRECLCCG